MEKNRKERGPDRHSRSWIALGGIVGLAAGFVTGPDYVLAGLAIGLAGGFGIHMGLRRRR